MYFDCAALLCLEVLVARVMLIGRYALNSDFRTVWLGLANSQEQYILRYESKYLRELGQAMEYIANIAITAAVKHTLKQTLLSGSSCSRAIEISADVSVALHLFRSHSVYFNCDH